MTCESCEALKELLRELWISGKNASQRLQDKTIDKIRLDNALKAVKLYSEVVKKSTKTPLAASTEKNEQTVT